VSTPPDNCPVAVKSERKRRGRPGLRGLIAVRIRPPMIRGHLTGDLGSLDGVPSFFPLRCALSEDWAIARPV